MGIKITFGCTFDISMYPSRTLGAGLGTLG